MYSVLDTHRKISTEKQSQPKRRNTTVNHNITNYGCGILSNVNKIDKLKSRIY